MALWHTVLSFSSLSSARVWANVSEVGRRMRSHSGSRGRAVASAGFATGMLFLQLVPELGQLIRPEIGQKLAIHLDHRRQFLARKADHLVESRFIGNNIDFLVIYVVLIE